MTVLFRDGYWRDVVVLLVVTVLLGSGVAWSVGWGVDAFFGDAIQNLVGEAGEYDALIQIRDNQDEAPLEALQHRVAESLPGAQLQKAVSLAGQSHYLLRLPSELRQAETFTALRDMFQDIPGYVGLTYMVEPSISVTVVHPAVARELEAAFAEHPDVDFVFHKGDGLQIVLKQAESMQRVTQQVEAFLANREILEVRMPLGVTLPHPEATATELKAALEEAWGDDFVLATGADDSDEDIDAFVATLSEMRNFLLGYATRVEVAGAADRVGSQVIVMPAAPVGHGAGEVLTVRLESVTDDGAGAWGFIVSGTYAPDMAGAWTAFEWLPDGSAGEPIGTAVFTNEQGELEATLAESVQLLNNLAHFAEEAREGVGQAQALLDSFEDALQRLAGLSEQVNALEHALAAAGSEGPVNVGEVVLPLLVSNWLARNSAETAASSPLEQAEQQLGGLDVSAIHRTLQLLAGRFDELANLDVAAVVRQIEQVQRTLPHLNDGDIARSIDLIDRNLDGSTIAGDRISLVTARGPSREEAEAVVRTVMEGDDVRVYQTAAGVVTPNARAALTQILSQMRQVVAALVAIGVVLLTLLLDHSALLSVLQSKRVGRREAIRLQRTARWLGAGTGALLLTVIGLLSGARLPYVGVWGLTLAGAVIGLVVALVARRINPVNWDEVVAGESLGLHHAQVMREIVIPAARPGLLVWLNRRNQRFA